MSYYTKNKLIDSNKNTAWMQALDLIEDGWKVFDIGCGNGAFGEELIKRKNCTVDAIEPDAGDAELASKKLRKVEPITAEDKELYTLFPEKYDAITFIDVIEHLGDPTVVLQKVKKMLKPGGCIIFSIPNMAHISVRFALLRGEFNYTQTGLLDQTHMHFYTDKEIYEVFRSAGYKVKELNCSSYTYPKIQSKKILNSIGLNPTKKFFETVRETQGYVYQYVGKGVPSKTDIKQKKPPKVNPHESDYKVIEETIDNYKTHTDHLQKMISLKDRHIKNLDAVILDMKQSKAWKVHQGLNRIKAKIKRS